jgi:hypothetical protein
MIDDENNNQSNLFKTTISTNSHLFSNIFSEKNKSEYKELGKNKEYVIGNCCYKKNISRIDNALKNMHKRWSNID